MSALSAGAGALLDAEDDFLKLAKALSKSSLALASSSAEKGSPDAAAVSVVAASGKKDSGPGPAAATG